MSGATVAAARPWLHVVGVGDGGEAAMPPDALALIRAGEVVVGGERHHRLFPDLEAERLTWGRPLEATLDQIAARRGRRVVVLASGDPMCFGIGVTLRRRFGLDEMRVVPAPSAAALARARLGWAEDEVELLSLHHGPAARLRRHLWPGARLILLAEGPATPGLVADMLREEGYGPSRIWIFEHLGGQSERVVEAAAERLEGEPFAALNLIAVECAARPGLPLRPAVPGLPDDVFASDGMLTRREVRAVTLARLQPGPGQLLIDVGAGSGSIGIEWLRAARRGRAVAVERDPARCSTIRGNADALGTPELVVVEDEAPGCLARLEPADAVFVGGGLGDPGMLEAGFARLRPGGRLVANAVTLEGEQALLRAHRRHGGELVRIEVSRAGPVGRLTGWRPAMPVTQLAQVRA